MLVIRRLYTSLRFSGIYFRGKRTNMFWCRFVFGNGRILAICFVPTPKTMIISEKKLAKNIWQITPYVQRAPVLTVRNKSNGLGGINREMN